MREAEVREAIEVRVQSDLANRDARLIPELGLCQAQARIDLAVVDTRLTGWEIKTAHDTLARLPSQAEVYSRIFDRMWLVAHVRHIERASEFLPAWWGMIEVEERSQSCHLTEVRRPRINPCVDLASLVRLLWRDEALDELTSLGLSSGYRRAPRRQLWKALVDASPVAISPAQLQARVRDRLRSRQGWRSAEPRTSSDDSS